MPPMRHGPMGPRKPKDTKAAIARLFTYVGVHKVKIIIALTFVILRTLANLAASYMLRPIINNYIVPGGGVEMMKGLAMGLALLGSVYLINIFATYMQSRIMAYVSQNTLEAIRVDLFTKVQKLPVRYYDTNSTGDMMSRFTNDVDNIGMMLDHTLVSIFSGTITLVGTLAMMIYTNIWLTLITIFFIPVFMKAGAAIGKHSRKYYGAQQAALGAVNGYIEESVTGQKVVKVFCHEEKCEEEFGKLNQDLRDKQIKAQFFGGIMGPIMGNMSQISYAVTACVGGIFCAMGNFDIGGLTVFVNYSRQFSFPISELSMQVTNIFSALAGAERVFAMMDVEPEAEDAEDAVDMKEMKGHVILDNVTFGYNPDKTILKNISLYAKPGQKIAFVGSTGAGKTTITNLINRFYDIADGKIRYDGININKIKKSDLRRSLGVVLQDTNLVTGTVMDNIRYGNLTATDEECIEAAKLANAHDFITRLPKGYDTELTANGASLSQGQRQLIAIARAAVADPPVMILDEATSSIDTRTEKLVQDGMDKLMAGRTVFVIAHRLSTVKNSNCIMVLDHGRIIERGTHDDLIAEKGTYYQLYTGAFELE